MVDQILGDDDVDHAERQRGIGAGLDGQVPVGLLGGPRGDGVDDHDLGAAALRLRDERPVMQVVADRVDRPQNDVSRVDETLRVHRSGRAAGHKECGDGGGIAEGALGHRGAELVEEGVPRVQPVQDAFRTEVAVWHDGGGAVTVDDLGPAAGNFLQRLVPGDRLELPGALGAGAAQRRQHPVVAVDPIFVIVDLDAEPAPRERVIRVAPYGNRLAVTNGGQHRAGVRTIMRTRAENSRLGHDPIPPFTNPLFRPSTASSPPQRGAY